MARVICTLPNASTLINGIPFVADRGQVVALDLTDDVAEQFDGIPGYIVRLGAGAPAASAEATPDGSATTEATTDGSATTEESATAEEQAAPATAPAVAGKKK